MSLPGKILYHAWHRPVGKVRDLIEAGGPFAAWRTGRGRRAMEAAAHTLPAPSAGPGAPVGVHLLTGHRFWYQTAFCLWTLAHHAQRPLAPVLYDDGTLAAADREVLQRLFPTAVLRQSTEMEEQMERRLPVSRFPVLRERRAHYPNLRKLTDVHAGATGWKLVLDSDLLFFRRPDLLLAWLDRPTQPLHAVDCETSYGYSRPLLDTLAGAPMADLVNVGLTGLAGEEIDWERLEQWCATLIARERTSYYLEQALVAMLVAGRQCTVAPASDYVTRPVPPEARDCHAVMHHYVAGSKRWYFQHCWRHALAC